MHPAAASPRARFTFALMAFLLLGPSVPAWPAVRPAERASLNGITAIWVVVEDMNPEAERDGLTKAQLQTDVELRLRKAGIRVASSQEEGKGSVLYLYVNTTKHSSGLYAYNTDHKFGQRVILARNQNLALFAMTWSALGKLGLVGAKWLRDVRDDVADCVDQFINDYLEQGDVLYSV
jgi:hypothetical protein